MRLYYDIKKRYYLAHGVDHALGSFVTMFDRRPEDPDKEVVFDYDELFGISYNKLDLQFDTINYIEVMKKCKDFIKRYTEISS